MNVKKPNADQIKRATNAGIVGVIGYATTVDPGLGIAVSMASAYFGPAIVRRLYRAKELVKHVQDNIADFPPVVLGDKVFQDGFVLLLEKYIRERNDNKRLILQKVLQGYVKAPNLLDYPLEEMTDLVSRVRMSDVEVLRIALEEEAKDAVNNANRELKSFMLQQDPNAVSRLIYFGLLHEDRTKSGPVIREYDQKSFLYVWVSPTGREFAKYINNNAGTGA
ncbi:MAG: hypothetical protein ABSD13_20815 [Candidatus Korobacteraceae bacterium]|jgi:hypothetical protein